MEHPLWVLPLPADLFASGHSGVVRRRADRLLPEVRHRLGDRRRLGTSCWGSRVSPRAASALLPLTTLPCRRRSPLPSARQERTARPDCAISGHLARRDHEVCSWRGVKPDASHPRLICSIGREREHSVTEAVRAREYRPLGPPCSLRYERDKFPTDGVDPAL